jgi:hypothetical protein
VNHPRRIADSFVPPETDVKSSSSRRPTVIPRAMAARCQ